MKESKYHILVDTRCPECGNLLMEVVERIDIIMGKVCLHCFHCNSNVEVDLK